MKLDVEARAAKNSFRARVALTMTVLALGAMGVVGQSGCSNQAEGQRCNTQGDNGGTDDCQAVSSTGVALVCKPTSQLNGAQDSLCCPQDPSKATVSVCQAPGTGGIVPPAPTATSDASQDSATDTSTSPDTSVLDSSKPDTTPGTDASDDGSTDGGAG